MRDQISRVGGMRWAFAFTALAVTSCGNAPSTDHAAPDEVIEDTQEPLCSPALTRYPVAGPHNGGYDKNALNYTCHPHPSSSPDGSDFLAGDHYGNDVFAAKGTPLVAPVSGTVVTAGTNTAGGNVVKIRDACNWDYYHAHLDYIEPGIKVGMKINAGTKIGVVGNSGNAQFTSAHLHFSVFPAGNYNAGIDPFPLLQKVDATACGGCKRHCEGTVIVDESCNKGDCAAYGSSCIDDAKGVRCVVFYCADQPATAHGICLLDGNKGQCDALGKHTDLGPCPAGTSCKAGACVAPGGSGGSGSGSGGKTGSGGSSTGGKTGSGGSASGSGGSGSGGSAGLGASGGEGGVAGSGWSNGGAEIVLGGRTGADPRDEDGADGDVEGEVGCGVASAHGNAVGSWILLLGLLLWRRRRQAGAKE
ncbi:MAG: M23 family metallopeptidase [Polyangiaceae bacterium]